MRKNKFIVIIITLLIILSAGFAYAKYVLFSENKVTVTLKDATINETQITISPSSWTNNKVAVTIESEKGGQIYYKVGESGTWEKYTTSFDVHENDTVYSKLVFDDASGPETLKDVTNIDKIPPTTTAPTTTVTTSKIVVTSKQKDYESGIVYEEYAIKKDGVWYTQQLNNFEGLKYNTTYVVKTIATDLAGNVSESEELEVTTANMTLGTITFKKDNAGGEALTISESPETEKVYVNSNVYFDVKQGENGQTTYEVIDEGGNKIDVTDNILQTSTGTYIVTLITTDGSNKIEQKYYIYIDKTPPTTSAPNVEVTTGKITLTNNQTDLESGILKIEYGIFDEEQNKWVWQDEGTFSELTPNKEYKVKTKATDKAGNTSESFEAILKTKELTGAKITVKENDENKEEIIPSTSEEDTNKDWTDKDIIIETKPEIGTTVTVVVKDQDGNVVNKNEDGSYSTTDGKYEITVTTKDEDGNTVEDKYYIFVDKTKPILTLDPNGKEYLITPGNTNAIISVATLGTENGSGISVAQYAWSTSNTVEPTEWSNFAINTTIENTVNAGTYYLWTKVIDDAGNVADQKVSESYTVKYQIVYNANGGENAPPAQAKALGEDLILTDEMPTRQGYTFKGWATSNTVAEVEYTAGGTYSADVAVKLYAVWEVNTYNITYNTNGGNFAEIPDETYTYGKVQALPVPTKEGYTFEGWYEDEALKNRIDQINADKYGDLNLYANYTANKYIIQYNGNEATSGETASYEATYDQNVTISDNGFTKTGYTFINWNTQADGQGTSYIAGATVKNLSSKSGEIITLYAIWKDVTGPTTTAPSATSNVSNITITSNQTDDGAGIDETTIEYGINKDGTWVWQKDPTFTGLNSDTEYEVKTRASDKNGNGPIESEITKIKTTALEIGDLTFRKDNETGEIIVPNTDTISDKKWVNTDIYVILNPSSNGTTTYTVKKDEEAEDEYTANQAIQTKTGTYEIRVTTRTESENYDKTYYIYVDKTAPTSELPTATSTTGKITVTNNQTDNESGIAKVEYGILKGGTWVWQDSNTFTGLTANTEYEIRTKVTDNAGNVTETASVTISTKEVTPSTVKITESESGDEITPSTNKDDTNKDWTNENIKVEITTPQGTTTEKHIYNEDGTEILEGPDGTYALEDGTYKVVVTTKDEYGNTKEETYYVFVDKTKPEVTVTPDGGKYEIEVGQTTATLSATINVTENESGTDLMQYAWSTSQIIIPEKWNDFTSGTQITYPAEGGKYYLWLNVTDKAGNKATKKLTNVYTVVYKVEYNANGGQNAPNAQEKEKGIDLTISGTVPTKTGYTFKGWAESESDTTVKYGAGDVYSANSSVRLYAVWEANIYNITYNTNGGTFSTDPNETYTYNEDKILPTSNDITKPGYDFDGWYNEKGEKIETITAGTINDITLEAHWTARNDTEYIVNYYLENANNADYTLNHTEAKKGTTDTIIQLSDVQNPTTEIANATYNSSSLTSTTKIDAVNKTTVNVYYTRNKYTLNLVAGDNITKVTGANSYKWGQSVTINATIENLAGYAYKWNKWTSNDTSVLANQVNQLATITMPSANVTLTASATRTIIEYTITKQVKKDDSLDSNKTVEIKYNVETEDFELTSEEILGYTFKGWTINDETQLYDTITITKGTTGNNTYTAVYADETAPSNEAPTGTSTTNEITLTFNQTDLGSGIDESTIEYGIYKNGEWEWSKTPTFEGLDANTDYKVKTRVTDNKGNGPIESLETTIKTKSVDESTITFRKDSSSGSVINFPNTDDLSVWVNTNIHVTLNSTETQGVTTTYKIVDENGTEQTLNSDGVLTTTTGKYTATVTTTDGVNEKTITYYIYVDKTAPSATVTPNGGNYFIPVGSETTTVTPTINAVDEGGSNLNSVQYAWSTSNTTPPENWTNVESGNQISKALSGGTNYLWTKVTDNAGNTVTKASSGFKIGYIIEYDANGGDTTPVLQQKEHDVNISLADEITKTGYDFKEWNTNINGTGTEYSKSAIYTANESVKLYAIWTAKTFDITYNLDGGTINNNDDFKKYVTYTYDAEKVLPTKNDVTKPGYELDYWYDSEGNKYTTLPVGTIENITLTAHWKPTTAIYTVYHYVENINDANYTLYTTDSNVSGVTESVITIADLAKTITGATYKQGSITEGGTPVTTVTISGDGSTQIYLYYTRNTYTLTINKNANIGAITGSGTYKYGKTVAISAEFANLPGYNYTWDGWNSTDISVPTEQTASITMPNKNVTITAEASKTIIDYSITYNLDGGQLADGVTNPTLYTVESEEFTLNNPTRTGYTFVGWDDGEGNVNKTVIISLGTVGNKTYTAKWTTNGYTVTYDYTTNGGTSTTKETDTKQYNTPIDLTPVATKDGYNFVGWNTDQNEKTGLTNLTMETSDITLYAIFSKDITVTYKANGGTADIIQEVNPNTNEKYVLYNNETSLNIVMPEPTTHDNEWEFLCFGESANSIIGYEIGETVTIIVPTNKNGITLYTNWKKDINVKFVDYNEETKSIREVNVTAYNGETASVTAPSQNEYTNWTKKGWTSLTTTTAVGTNTNGGIITGLSANAIYYGLYEQTITLSYDLNGGTSELIKSQTGTRKVNSSGIENITNPILEISTEAPIKAGYNFTNTWKDANNNIYEAGSSYTFTENITISAVWDIITYNLTFDLNGGSLPEGVTYPSTYTIESEDITITPYPTKTGYKFSGWSLQGEDEIYNPLVIKKGSTGDKVYVANYPDGDIVEYTVESYYQKDGIYSETPDYSKINTGTTDKTVSVTDEEKTPKETNYIFDSSASNILTGTVKADGSLVLKVYFKEQFTVKYLPGEKGSFTEQVYSGLDYGAQNPEFEGEKTSAPGYHFASWSPEIKDVITENTIYTAIWQADTDTPYTIEYYYQENGVYADTPTITDEARYGTTDTTITLSSGDKTPTREGYVYDTEANNITTGLIAGDGSLVLKVYYKQQFTVTYTAGTNVKFTEEVYENLDYGVQRPELVATVQYDDGYGNGEWNPSLADTVTENVTYTLNAKPNTNTPYTVEYYYQENGVYSDIPTSSDNTRTGTTNEIVSVTNEDKTPVKAGYVLDETAENVLTGRLAGNGSLVLKVYFKMQFTVTYKAGTHVTFAEEQHQNLDYGAETPQFNGNISYDDGYGNGEWNPSLADTVTENVTYTLNAKPNTNTPYTVEYYYQENGVYPDVPTSSDNTRLGTTDEIVSVTNEDKIPTKTGYILDESAQNVLTGTLAGNGSLVLRVYFKEQFTVIYKAGTHVTFEEEQHQNLDYGAETPQFNGNINYDDGYGNGEWTPELENTVTSNITYTLNAKPNTNTPYTVEYYYQENGAYSDIPTSSDNTRTGTTDGIVSVTDEDKTPTKTGYILDESAQNVLTGTLAGNGSLVLKVYFKEQFTVKYLKGTQGTFTEQIYENLDYGTTTPEFEGIVSCNSGYTFSKWNPDVASIVTENATYTATYTANTNTPYTVHIYGENAENTEFSFIKDVIKTGTTDSSINVDDIKDSLEGYGKDSIIAKDSLNGNTITNLKIKGDGSSEIYLYYSRNTYTLNLQAGTNIKTVTGAGTYKWGTSVQISAVINTDDGNTYNWLNWTSNNTSILGDQAEQNATIIMPIVPDGRSLVLTASASANANEYSITYVNVDGIDNSQNPETYTYGTAITFNNPGSKTGYAFEGWFTDENLTKQITGITENQTGNITVYAKWTINKYTVTYNAMGGNCDTTIIENVEYGTKINVNPEEIVATKANYVFKGWTTDSVSTTPLESLTMGTSDITLYAIYVEAVAQIGTSYYETLQDAVDAAGVTDDAVTIIMLKSVSSSGTVATTELGQNIILNLNSKEITSTATNISTIVNKGTLTVTGNGTINGTYRAINNNSSTGILTIENINIKTENSTGIYNTSTGTINIKSGTITAGASGVWNAGAGIINITGGTIIGTTAQGVRAGTGEATISGSTTNIQGVTFGASVTTGKLTITAGTITATDGEGVAVTESTGILTIGTKDLTVSTTVPKITGTKYGAKLSKGTLNFYDGVLKGASGTSVSTPSDIPGGYGVQRTTENDIETAILVKANYAEYDSNSTCVNTYETLADATANVISGNTIKPIVDTTEVVAVTIPEDKTLTLNLNGKNININSSKIITNNGNLTIEDSSNGTLTTTGYLKNMGTLTINSGTIIGTNNYHTIMNESETANTIINGGTINSTYDGNMVAVYITKGNLNVKGGTITSKYRAIISNANNTSGVINIDGGTITAIGGANIGYQAEAFYIAGGTLNISGGTFTADKGEYSSAWAGQIGSTVPTTITGGTFEGSTMGLSIYGSAKIDNATITCSNGSGIYNYGTETIEISNSTITSETASGIVNNATGNVIVKSGTIKGKTNGIYSKNGEVTLGINEDTPSVSITSPEVEGGSYGVRIIETDGKFYFYDGVIRGPVDKSVSGTVTATPTGYGRRITNDGTTETSILVAKNYREGTSDGTWVSYYETLADAMECAQSGNTIQVLADTTETIAPTLAEGKILTLNLNSKTVSLNNVTLTNNGTLTIDGAGTLTGSGANTLTNEGIFTKSGTSTIKTTATATYYAISNTGTATLTSGTVDSSYRGINNRDSGKVVISGATVSSTNITIYNTGTANTTSAPAVKVTSGTLSSTNNSCIYNNSAGMVYVTGGTITGGSGIWNNAAGLITITGGTITGTTVQGVRAGAGTATISGTSTKITGVTYGSSVTTGKLTITAGTITATGGDGVAVTNDTGILTIGTKNSTVSTTVPSITGTKYGAKLVNGTLNFYDGVLKGASGTSVSTPSDIPDGYGVQKTIEGDIETAILVIANYAEYDSSNTIVSYYATLANAFSDARSGNTIKPLVDITETVIVTNKTGNKLTLDLNGKTITMTGASINNSGDLSITGTGKLITSGANTFNNNGTLSISTTGGTIKNTATQDYRILSNQSGTATINSSGSLESSYIAIANDGTAKLVIQKGTISSTKYSIYNKGTINDGNEASIVIKGGTITSTDSNTIYNNSTGLVKISGGTIVQSTASSAIFNNSTGTIEVTSGTITKQGTGGSAIYNNAAGKINVSKGAISATVGQGIRGATGTVRITGGTITGSSIGASITSGVLEITGGTIEATGDEGIGAYTNTGTLTIGTNETTPSVNTTVPSIKGVKYGIQKVSTDGTINFYDGVIRGPKGYAINGAVNSTPTNYGVVYTIEDTIEAATLAKTSDRVCRIGTYYFTSIQNAINYAKEDESEIVMLKSVSKAGTQGTISAGQNITLNLATYSVATTGGGSTLVNKGTLNVKGTTGKLECTNTGNYVIHNTGSATITSGTITSSVAHATLYNNASNAILTVNGGTISSTYDGDIHTIYANLGTITINEGTITSKYRCIGANNENVVVNITGGTIKAVGNANASYQAEPFYVQSGTLNISGGTFIGETGEGTHGAWAGQVGENATATITGGEFTGETGGLGFYSESGTNKLENAKVTATAGWGVLNYNGATFETTNSTISGPTGIYQTNAGEIIVNSGTIEGTGTSGLGIHSSTGKVTINGGDISGVKAIEKTGQGLVMIYDGTITSTKSGTITLDYESQANVNVRGGSVSCATTQASAILNYSTGNVTIGKYNDTSTTTPSITGRIYSSNESFKDSDGYVAAGGNINLYAGSITATTTSAVYGIGTVHIENAKITASKSHTVVLGDVLDTSSIEIRGTPIIENTGNYYAVTTNNNRTQSIEINASGGSITSTQSIAVNNRKGTTTIFGAGTITGATYGIYTTTGTIDFRASLGKVNNVYATGENGVGMHASTGTINIGQMDYAFLQVTPEIKGKKYGVQISGEGTFNYGDGYIYGGTNAISNAGTQKLKSYMAASDEYPNGLTYGINYSQEATDIGETSIDCEKAQLVVPNYGSFYALRYDPEYQTRCYADLKSAIENESSIYLLKNVSEEQEEDYTVNKDFSLSPFHWRLSLKSAIVVQKDCTLEIPYAGYGGTVESSASSTIKNAGTLNISCTISNTSEEGINGSTIENTGTLLIDNYGTVKATTAVGIRNADTGVVTMNNVTSGGIQVDVTGDPNHYAIRSSSTATNAITVEHGTIYGDGGIFGANITMKAGYIEAATSNAIATMSKETTITIGDESISPTYTDSYNVPVLKAKVNAVKITTSTAKLNYYTGILYGGTKAINYSGTTNVRPGGYKITNSKEEISLNGETVNADKAVLSK